MAKWGKCNFNDLKKLQRNLERLSNEQRRAFFITCSKELAARLLAKAIERTPVGQYPSGSGKVGGTLRRGWTGSKDANAVNYINSLSVTENNGEYIIEIINPVEYASYVEFGHRTGNGGFVDGRFMLTISAEEIEQSSPAILEKKLNRLLEGLFK